MFNCETYIPFAQVIIKSIQGGSTKNVASPGLASPTMVQVEYEGGNKS